MIEKSVVIEIGEQGTGRTLVPEPHIAINRVVVSEPHGNPHVLPARTQPGSWIEVLGAVPNSEVTVTYRI